MELIKYLICDHEGGCSHLATVIGKIKFNKCIRHLDRKDRQLIKQQSNTNLRNSVLDGRDDEGAPSYRIPFPFRKGADLRGSLFLSVDISSEDLDEVDLSYSQFFGCDIRRTRLHNASLRLSWFNRCLVRQANINHTDARWLVSCAKEITGPADLIGLMQHLAWRKSVSHDCRLRLVPKEDAQLFLRRFGVKIKGEEFADSLLNENYNELVQAFERIYQPQKQANSSYKSLLEILTLQVTFGPDTDWSGSTIRDSDLAYARLDSTIAHEVVFDGSDLHGASFVDAELYRSSFINVSFARFNGKNRKCANAAPAHTTAISRFLRAKMDGCILDGANLEALLFEETSMSSARLPGARLVGAVFFKCNLQNITGDDLDGSEAWFLASDLSGASLRGSIFSDSKSWWEDESRLPFPLSETIESRLSAEWAGYDLEERQTKMRGTNLQASDFRNAFLHNVALNGSMLQGADLTDANLSGAICLGAQFAASNVTNANFHMADLTSTDFSDSGPDATKCPPNFSGANLEDATLKGMDLTKAVFRDVVSLEGADLSECRLIGTQFYSSIKNQKLKLKRATFRNARLDETRFVNVDLQASDLSFCSSESATATTFYRCNLGMASLRALVLKKVEWNACDLEKTDLSDIQVGEAIFNNNCDLANTLFSDATILRLIIDRPERMSNSDFEGARIGTNEGEKSIIRGRIDSTDSIGGISFDKSELFSLSFENIDIISSSFFNASLNGVLFKQSFFLFVDFKSCNLEIDSIDEANFIFCEFSKCGISVTKTISQDHNKTPLFYGCKFDTSKMPEDLSGVVFIDCNFVSSGFLSSYRSTNKWSSALPLQCQFSGHNLHGLCEIDTERGVLPNEKISANKLTGFLNNHIQSMVSNTDRLEAIRIRFQDKPQLSKWKDKIDYFIPSKGKSDIRKDSYSSAYNICLEIRKDLFSRGQTDAASTAYVVERDYYRKTFITNNKLRKVLCKIDSSLAMISFPVALTIYALFFMLLSRISAGLAVAAPLIVLCIGLTPLGGISLSKYLYDYGENVRKILFSAIGCVAAFTFLFYAFVPDQNQASEAYCYPAKNERRGDEGDNKMIPAQIQRPLSIFRQLFTPAQCPATGHLVEGGQILTKGNSGWFDLDALITCFYLSGVTFTTLGYGDIQPFGIVRLLTILEAGIGASLMALFVFSFTRRNAQR